MSSSTDDALIEAGLQDFSSQLHLAFPLRHFGEFYDEEQLKEKILQLNEKVSKTLFSKVWNRDKEQVFSLLKRLHERMNEEAIAEWTTKNEKRKIEFVSCLQRRAEMLCDDFQMGLEDQLLLHPKMKMNSFKKCIDQGKVFAVNYFDTIWKPKSCKITEERRRKMVKNLDAIGEEVLVKHKHVLERTSVGEGEKLLDEVKTILMENLRQLQSYVNTHPGRVSKSYVKAEVADIQEYLMNGKGSALRVSQKEIYSKLAETLEDGIKFLTDEDAENESAKSPEDLLQWVEVFVLKVKSYCSNDEGSRDEAQGVEEEGNSFDISQRYGWIRINQILKEDPLGFWEQEEPKPGSRNREEDHNDKLNERADRDEVLVLEKATSKGNVRPGPATAPNRKRLRRSRSLNSSMTDKDQKMMKDHGNVATQDSPLPKKDRTGDNVSIREKNITKADSSANRLSSRVKEKIAIAAQAAPSRRNSRLKKNSDEPSVSKGTADASGNADKRKSGPSICLDQITSVGGDPPTYKCDVCKRKIKKTSSLKYHGKFCWKTRRAFKCDHCGMGFPVNSKLVNHIRRHTGEKPYQCTICDKRFRQQGHLGVHIRSHTENTRLICEKCKQSFKSPITLNRHMLHHEGKLPFGCNYCDQRCVSMPHLMGHLITHSDEQPFYCVTCNKQFCVRHPLVRHLQQVHRLQKEDANKLANDASLEYLKRVTNNPNYDGDISSTVVLSHALRKANLMMPSDTDKTSSAHAIPSSSESIRPKLPNCLEQITNLGGDPPTYKCDVCKKEIIRKTILKHHGKNCTREELKCHHCDKQFFKMSALVVHLRTHTGEKPFKCPTCNKKFTDKSNLTSHCRTHAYNRKPSFNCDKCTRSYYYRSELKRHMLKHEGKLIYRCRYCETRFATTTQLKKHAIIHHSKTSCSSKA